MNRARFGSKAEIRHLAFNVTINFYDIFSLRFFSVCIFCVCVCSFILSVMSLFVRRRRVGAASQPAIRKCTGQIVCESGGQTERPVFRRFPIHVRPDARTHKHTHIQSERKENINRIMRIGRNGPLLCVLRRSVSSSRINSRSTNTLTCHGIERDPHL